jgi:hypothetical protein
MKVPNVGLETWVTGETNTIAVTFRFDPMTDVPVEDIIENFFTELNNRGHVDKFKARVTTTSSTIMAQPR